MQAPAVNLLSEALARYEPHLNRCHCARCAALAEDMATRIIPVPADITDAFITAIRRGKASATVLHQPIWDAYYLRLRALAEAGYGRSLSLPANWDELSLFERLKTNLSYFSAAKVRTASAELELLKMLPQKEYLQAAASVMDRHNRLWLPAEQISAMASAQSAESWGEIKRRSILYPNLRYETAGDERVRTDHRLLDGAVHPVSADFWDTWMPPNGWRCRCKVVQTDQPANGISASEVAPDVGFRHNPGKTGQLFSADHPYFAATPPAQRQALQDTGESYRAVFERDSLQDLAERYIGSTFKLPGGIKDPMQVTAQGIDRALASAHSRQPAIKNDLVAALKTWIARLKLASKDMDRIVLALELLGEKYYIQVQTSTMEILSITDAP